MQSQFYRLYNQHNRHRQSGVRTRDISSHGTGTLITWDFNFDEPSAHIEIDSTSHEVVASDTGDEFSKWFNKRSSLDGTDTSGREEGGESKVCLRGNDGNVVGSGRKRLDQSDRLKVSD